MTVRRSGVGYADFSGGDANHIIGCTPVSAGCANCYARALIEDRGGRDFSKIRLYPDKLRRLRKTKFQEKGQPFRRGSGSRPLVFPVDLGDHFHPDVPSEYLMEVFDVYASRRYVDWLVLTKRSFRAWRMFEAWERSRGITIPANIWVGVTIEHPDYLEERLEDLVSIRAQVRWLSLEPMLAPLAGELEKHLAFYQALNIYSRCGPSDPLVNWIVAGAESGPHRRDYEEEWGLAVRDMCAKEGIPFFYKQGSHLRPGRNDTLQGHKYKAFPGDLPRCSTPHPTTAIPNTARKQDDVPTRAAHIEFEP